MYRLSGFLLASLVMLSTGFTPSVVADVEAGVEADRPGGRSRGAEEEALATSVDVSPTVFSPNGDGRRDAASIRVETLGPADVTVRVLDGAGTTRRRWEAASDRTVVFEWDGLGDAGHRVRDGRYTVEAVASRAGVEETASTAVTVDTRPPGIAWMRIRPNPVARARWVALRFRTRDRSRHLHARLRVLDAAGEVVVDQTEAIQRGIRRLRWRPRHPKGGRLYPGPYRVELTVRDEAMNAGTDERVARVERPTRAAVWRRVDGAGRRVALTFDDCHFRGAWGRILRVLRDRRTLATFFCPGRVLLANPDLARRTVAAGHTAGAHGWDHAVMTGYSPDRARRALEADDRAWWTTAGTTGAPYFRPPYGAHDRGVLRAAGASSHPRVIMWDVDAGDWHRPGAAAIASRTVRAARPGSIILLHTIDQTASALPAILHGLRRRGLQPVTLPELFRAAGHR